MKEILKLWDEYQKFLLEISDDDPIYRGYYTDTFEDFMKWVKQNYE